MFGKRRIKNKYRILSIDGGGMKGVFTAYAIWKLEEEYNIKIMDYFDMVVGTSTGALIGAALLIGQPGKYIYDTYMDPENKIFKTKNSVNKRVTSKFYSQYSDEGILEYLKEQIGEHTLETLYTTSGKMDFAFFASNFTKAKPIIYGSPSLSNSDLIRSEATAIEVLRATSAAPFYFEPLTDEKTGDLLLDGGLWANNPSLAGFSLALGDLGVDANQIEILSFGQTDTSNLNFQVYNKKEVIVNPMRQQFVQLLLSSLSLSQNSQSALIKNLLGDRLYRYEPEVSQEGVAIDKIDTKFVNYAKVYWTKNKESLVEFIKTSENNKKYD